MGSLCTARVPDGRARVMQGHMPALLSHYRPDCPIFCFTEDEAVQRRLALYHGVTALRMRFGEAADETFDRCSTILSSVLPRAAAANLECFAPSITVRHACRRAIVELKQRGYVKGGQQVAIVQSGRQPIWRSSSTHAIQASQVQCS